MTWPSSSLDLCARCDMEQSDWEALSGVEKDGELYCCDDCAQNLGCVCAPRFLWMPERPQPSSWLWR